MRIIALVKTRFPKAELDLSFVMNFHLHKILETPRKGNKILDYLVIIRVVARYPRLFHSC